MNDTPRYATFRDYLNVIRSRGLMVVVMTLVFGGIALAVAIRQDPVYRAEVALSVDDISQDPAILGTQLIPSTTPEGRAAVTAALVNRVDTVNLVKKDLNLAAPIRAISSRVSGQTEVRTLFVIIQAKSGNPRFAAALANAFGRAVRREGNSAARDKYLQAAKVTEEALKAANKKVRSRSVALQQFQTQALLRLRLSNLKSIANYVAPVKIVERASVPSTPISPKPVQNTVIGLLIGLILAIVLAFLRDALDRRFRSAGEIRDALDLPLVGHVRDDLMGRTMVSSNGRAALTDTEMEAFRIMRSNLQYLDIDSPPKTLLITSPVQEEGKSTVSTSISTAMAFAGKRTLLVECDMRRPVMAKRLGLETSPGLSDYLIGRAGPTEVTQTVTLPAAGNGDAVAPSFVVITAGTPTPRPAELLGSQKFRAFLEQVSEAYDQVILDSCPLLSVGDTLELIPQVDGIVLCVRSSRTTRDQARAAKTALDAFGSRPTGIVVTGLRHGDETDYGYYSYAYGATA